MSEEAAAKQAEAEWRTKVETSSPALALEAQLAELDLTAEEKAEKAALLAEGFVTWSRRDFREFLAACEHHGRMSKEAVVAEVAEVTDKPIAEVSRYYDTFFARGHEMADWDRIQDLMAKAELKVKRREALETILAEKVAASPDPFRALPIRYDLTGRGAPPSNRGFTEDEDRFLICMTNILGYGAWDALRLEIRRCDQFRFNWFMKSRSKEDLQRRCDTLLRLVEREAVMEDGTIEDVVLGGAGGVAGAGKGKKPTRTTKAAATAAPGAAEADAVGSKRKRATPAAGGGAPETAAAAGGAGGEAAPAPPAKRGRKAAAPSSRGRGGGGGRGRGRGRGGRRSAAVGDSEEDEPSATESESAPDEEEGEGEEGAAAVVVTDE